MAIVRFVRAATGVFPALRLCVVNPNSDGRVTRHLAERAASVLPTGWTVLPLADARAPTVVETAEESAAAADFVVEAAEVRADAYLVGCFGNPGAGALRAMTGAPVVGLGEAALLGAAAAAAPVGVLTTLLVGVPAVECQVRRAVGTERCVGVLPVDEPPRARSRIERLASGGRRLVDEGAEGIVLACASFAEHSGTLSARLGVPVYDGVGLAAALARQLWLARDEAGNLVTG